VPSPARWLTLCTGKNPGVRPVGIGETFTRLFSKTILGLTLGEPKTACGADQLCSGLEAGIEGAIHAGQWMWDQHSEEENWGFLLVDAHNAFNQVNRTAMLWVVRHEWPSGCRFVFNSYQHWATLIIRSSHGADFMIFLLSREEVTQGGPLAVVAFGLAVMPLTRQLKREVHQVHQAWYANDAAAAADFTSIKIFMERLIELGPAYGYFPEALKSILVVSEANKAAAEVYFRDMKFKVVTGSRYLGGFIGSDHDLHAWLKDKVPTW
jgi:hypothetical protein